MKNNQFIRLLSYNLCWERMNAELGPKSKLDGTICKKKKRNICRYNVLNYLKYIQKNEKLDIICLQEESNIDKELKFPHYHKFVSREKKETIVTYWNNNKIQLLSCYHTHFSDNRPIQLMFFHYGNSIFVLFNIHAGHDKNNDFTNFIKVISKIKLSSIEKSLLKTANIIIAGDYNNERPIKDGKLNNKIIFGKRKFYNQTKEPTCCYNFEQRKPIKILDHILTTNPVSGYHINYINKHKYGYFSDHIPILALVKN